MKLIQIIGWPAPGELALLGPCYAKNPVEIQGAIFWSTAILNLVSGHVGGHFVRKISQVGAHVEKMLYAKSPIEIQNTVWI